MKSLLLKQTMQNHHDDLHHLVKLINENYLFLKTTGLLSGDDQIPNDCPDLLIAYNPQKQVLKLKLKLPNFPLAGIVNAKIQSTRLNAKLHQFDHLIRLYQLASAKS